MLFSGTQQQKTRPGESNPRTLIGLVLVFSLFATPLPAQEREGPGHDQYAGRLLFPDNIPGGYFDSSLRKFDRFYLINGSMGEAKLKRVSENHFVIETRAGKIITPKKDYFDKVVAKNGQVIFSRDELGPSVALLEGTLNPNTPPGITRVPGPPAARGLHPEAISALRFGLMAASLGAGIYSVFNYHRGDEISGERESINNSRVKGYRRRGSIALGLSGGMLAAGLISFAF